MSQGKATYALLRYYVSVTKKHISGVISSEQISILGLCTCVHVQAGTYSQCIRVFMMPSRCHSLWAIPIRVFVAMSEANETRGKLFQSAQLQCRHAAACAENDWSYCGRFNCQVVCDFTRLVLHSAGSQIQKSAVLLHMNTPTNAQSFCNRVGSNSLDNTHPDPLA